MICYPNGIGLQDRKLSAIRMAFEYRTAIQITDIRFTDKKWSAVRMVPLFECPVFGSPLYIENAKSAVHFFVGSGLHGTTNPIKTNLITFE